MDDLYIVNYGDPVFLFGSRSNGVDPVSYDRKLVEPYPVMSQKEKRHVAHATSRQVQNGSERSERTFQARGII